MTVCGKYVKRCSEASHVLFDGHLGDPSFRKIAIQKIEAVLDSEIVVSKSGTLAIRKTKTGERVDLVYECVLFGDTKTTGIPFKDVDTAAAIAAERSKK